MNKYQGQIAVAVLCLICLIVAWPLFRHGFFISDDGEWMIIRLSAFFQSFREGQFPVRFLGRLNNGYGYPVANFLYPGFLYLGSFIHLFGLTFSDSIKFIFFGSLISSAFFIYLWLRSYFLFFPGIIGAIGYILAPYISFDIFKRGSVGEMVAFVPASFGLYSIGAGKPWLLSFAVGCLVISHNSLAVLFMIVYGFYIVLEKKLPYFLPYTLGILMAGFFWIPALIEKKYVIFDTIKISDPSGYFITGQWYGLLGFASVLACFFLIFGKWKKSSLVKGLIVLFLGSVFFSLPVSSAIWKSPFLSSYLQFPFRFLAVSSVIGAWIIAALFSHLKLHTSVKVFMLFGVIWLVFIWNIQSQTIWVDRPESYYTTNEATTTVADEYTPVWAKEKLRFHPYERLHIYTGRADIKLEDKSNMQHIVADIFAEENSILEIQTIYYPGWGMTVDGIPTKIVYDNPGGLMRAEVPKGKHTIIADFRETPFRFTADLISFIGIILSLVYVFYSLRKKDLNVS